MSYQASLLELTKIANFMTRDTDLWLCRRYEKLHVFNILTLQQHLEDLDQQLEQLVAQESRQGAENVSQEFLQQRKSLLTDIGASIKLYDEAILSLAQIQKIQSPPKHILDIAKSYGNITLLPSLMSELGFPKLREQDPSELLAIATPPKSWLHRYVDKSKRLRSLFAVKGSKDTHLFTYKYSETKIKRAEFALVSASLCLVQLLPILALTLVKNKTWRLTMVMFLIVFVSILNSLFANTARATNFGAVAAYSAIIVVFIGQNT